MLALAGLCSMSFLTACSDSGSSAPSRSEACAKGLSEDCLVGVWTLNGVTDAGTGLLNPSHDFSAAPATIEFSNVKDEYGNTPFIYTFAGNSKDECGKLQNGGAPIMGVWEISGTSLILKPNSACYNPSRKTVTPTFTDDGVVIKMDLHELYLLNGDEMASADAGERAAATEVYSISAK